MSALARWLRSVGPTGLLPAGDEETNQSARSEASLYHCERCESVYVAVEKRTCESCDHDVDQVASTIAHS